ncbi:hypothetical protein O3P69_011712, partial [Scylla paramamosain]
PSFTEYLDRGFEIRAPPPPPCQVWRGWGKEVVFLGLPLTGQLTPLDVSMAVVRQERTQAFVNPTPSC